MVRLSKIYTKTGDDGSTGLGDGARVDKDDLRVEAYGTVDEANAAIGLCVVEAGRAAATDRHAPAVAMLLTSVQNDLFDVGADLCCPIVKGEKAGAKLRVAESQTKRLETAIDEHNARLQPLNSFVLPGGTALAAHLHLARTLVRRAERRAVSLWKSQRASTNEEAVKYLNRLSDLLFVLGRVANHDGSGDVKWVPGASRGK
jgi:cob(I)alamin adenosyltransferase